MERVKLETSNLVLRLIARLVSQHNAKVGQEGRQLRHVTYFYNFGTPCISLVGEARDFKFGVRIERQACKPKNLQK